MTNNAQCVGADLCDELRGSLSTSFHATYRGEPSTRQILKSQHLRLLADLSPLSEGHMLLVPVEHYLNFGQVIRDLGDELHALLAHITPRYEHTFGPLTILEHGSSSDMDSAACVTHAHWHLLPVDGQVIHDKMQRDGLHRITITAPDELESLADADEPYYYCAYRTQHAVYGIGTSMRKQYVRSLAGKTLGIPDPLWDYALVVRRQLLRATVRRAARWASEPEHRGYRP